MRSCVQGTIWCTSWPSWQKDLTQKSYKDCVEHSTNIATLDKFLYLDAFLQALVLISYHVHYSLHSSDVFWLGLTVQKPNVLSGAARAVQSRN